MSESFKYEILKCENLVLEYFLNYGMDMTVVNCICKEYYFSL